MAVDDVTYYARGGFAPSNWTEVASTYETWANLGAAFASWDGLAAGPIPDEDVLQVQISRQVASVFNRLQIGELVVLLSNVTDNYSPEGGGTMPISLNDNLTIIAKTSVGSFYSLGVGTVKKVKVDPALAKHTVLLDCHDVLKELRKDIRTGLQVDIRPNSLMDIVLDTAGIRSILREIDPNMKDFVDFAALDNIPGGDAVDQILKSGAHFAHVTGRGKVRVSDRNFDFQATAVASVDEMFGLSYALDLDGIINDAQIVSEPRKLNTDTRTVTFITDPIFIPSSKTISLVLEYLDPDTLETATPVNSIVTPVASEDYLLLEVTSLTNITSDARVVVLPFATTAIVEITNLNASLDGVLVKMQLRGQAIQRQPIFTAVTQIGSSQDEFGRQQFRIENNLVTNPLIAADYSRFLALRYHNPLSQIVLARKKEYPDVISTDLLDHIHVVNTPTGVGSSFTIMGIQHTISWASGREHIVKYDLEQFVEKKFLILDKDPEGKLDLARELAF